ncbi:hypothetical protein GCM10027591_16180 [Zhihengliuella somnathii]
MRLVGDLPELGAWDPVAAVVISCVPIPEWTAAVDLPAGVTFAYKYVKYDDGTVVWESGEDRVATVGADGSLELQDSWRS